MMCCSGSGKSREVLVLGPEKVIKINSFQVDSWQQKFEIKQQKIEMEQQKIEQEQNKMRLELQKGVWCGYQAYFNKANEKIDYDQLLLSSTNMNNSGVGLKVGSGKILSES